MPGLATKVVGAVHTELVLVRIAIGATALHVVDDSFLQPQPGTSAGDHLFAGWSRWRCSSSQPGRTRGCAPVRVRRSRSASASSPAPIASEAVRAQRTAGPSGDDYSGFGALAAAVVLLAIGTTTLWRSRRLNDRRTWRYLRRALIAVGAIVVVLQVAVPVGFAYLITHTPAASVPKAELGDALRERLVHDQRRAGARGAGTSPRGTGQQ